MAARIPTVAELLRRPITSGLVLAATGTTLLWEIGRPIDALTMAPSAIGPEPWRLLTSALPHVGLLHLAFNAYWLLVLGGAVEARCGPRITAALILATAIGSAALEHALFGGGVGLSGVGYGIFGFAWMAARRGVAFEEVVDARTVQTFLVWFVFCCITTLTGTFVVANAAHAGGLAIGVLAGVAWAEPSKRPLALGATLALTVACVVLASGPVRPFVNVNGIGQDLADEAYAMVDADPSAAIARYDAALARDPDMANWHYNRGVALQRAGRELEADAAYARAFELEPAAMSHREAVAATHARRANEALAAYRDDEAIIELRAAIELVPSHEFADEWRRRVSELEGSRDASEAPAE